MTPQLNLDEQALAHGDRLWERAPDRCCGIRKLAPLAVELASVDAWISPPSGAIRRRSAPARGSSSGTRSSEIAKINPLVGWTKQDVWRHIVEHDVPYNPLHDLGYPSIGCHPCTSRAQPGEDDRAGRWRGSARTECGLHGLAPAPH